ncbi:hypothetical protein [Sphaerisporangium sp. TRM90804]|uniref:hypothetical protein n=1 Tax=Sphaerisporangium sp. TRM90804 TaxID=3031113 RepID=UPI00244727DF|nr:hypothetical protein [Sphaerisporangium sp. TRM90804]MDH2428803.1 hypothetical protein [Sphaerisporangium sp. TRM90804]
MMIALLAAHQEGTVLTIWISGLVAIVAFLLLFLIRRVRRKQQSSATAWKWIERSDWIAGLGSFLVAVTALLVQVFGPTTQTTHPPGEEASPPSAVGKEETPPVVVTRNAHTLKASSWIATNDVDKVDLDSGHPGHGKSSIQLGPPRKGGPAEIILEQDRIHGYDSKIRYTLVAGTTTTHTQCAKALTHEADHLTEIPLDRLTPGTRLCVATDEARTALVRIVDRDLDKARLLLAFTTWSPKTG